MDYHNKILILNKYFRKYTEEKKLDDMYTSITSMKVMHGKIINDMMDVKNSKESNRLELLSDLQIISDKMSKIIQDAVADYEVMAEEQNNKEEEQRKQQVVHHDAPASVKLNSRASSLVLFYADWCGPCKAFLPTWNYIQENVKHNDLNIVKFSCVEHEEQCKQISFIKGYPTVILLENKTNIIHQYNGERTPNALIDFVNNKLKLQIPNI